MTFAQGFSSLLDEISSYTDEEAIEFYTSLLGCTDNEALNVFRLFREFVSSGMSKSARAAYKAAVDQLREKYGGID